MSRRRCGGGCAGRDAKVPRLTVWVAVLAVLAQAVLFEFAMAGRETAAARERAAAPAEHAHHHAHRGTEGDAPKRDRDVPRHEHGKDCPFCTARAMHQASSATPGLDLPAPHALWMPAPRPPRSRIRARRRPARLRCRSPPARAPMPIPA